LGQAPFWLLDMRLAHIIENAELGRPEHDAVARNMGNPPQKPATGPKDLRASSEYP
jgi:hypothetical protein